MPKEPLIVAQLVINLAENGMVFVGGKPPPVRPVFLMMIEEAKYFWLNKLYADQKPDAAKPGAIEVAPADLLNHLPSRGPG